MEYYAIINNKRQGPFTAEQLKELGIRRDTRVWHEGLMGWANAADVAELAEFAKEEGPAPYREPEKETVAGREQLASTTWIILSIITLILLPFSFVFFHISASCAICGIIHSLQGERYYAANRPALAERKLKTGRTFAIVGLCIAILGAIAYIAYIILHWVFLYHDLFNRILSSFQ